jgi:hypothetical protein
MNDCVNALPVRLISSALSSTLQIHLNSPAKKKSMAMHAATALVVATAGISTIFAVVSRVDYD